MCARTNEFVFSCFARTKKVQSDWWQKRNVRCLQCTRSKTWCNWICELFFHRSITLWITWTRKKKIERKALHWNLGFVVCACVRLLALCFSYFIQNDLTLSIAANVIYYFVFPPIFFSPFYLRLWTCYQSKWSFNCSTTWQMCNMIFVMLFFCLFVCVCSFCSRYVIYVAFYSAARIFHISIEINQNEWISITLNKLVSLFLFFRCFF